MEHSIKVGFSFGLTSGIITTLGLMVGLNSGTHSRIAVIGGILTIAIADAFSDALGIHVSEEAENVHTQKQVWKSTVSTFVTKFIIALTFLVPVLLLDLSAAVIAAVCWGLLALGFFSYRMAREQKEKPMKIIGEHIAIAILVVIATHAVGKAISLVLG